MTDHAVNIAIINTATAVAQIMLEGIEAAYLPCQEEQFATFSNSENAFLEQEANRYRRLASLMERGKVYAEGKLIP